MTVISAAEARTTLCRLIESLQSGRAPVLITGQKGNAVLVSEERWRALEENLFIASIPGMSKSIQKGMKEPVSKSVKHINL